MFDLSGWVLCSELDNKDLLSDRDLRKALAKVLGCVFNVGGLDVWE